MQTSTARTRLENPPRKPISVELLCAKNGANAQSKPLNVCRGLLSRRFPPFATVRNCGFDGELR